MKRYSKGEVGVKNRQGRYVLTFTCPTHHKRREVATGYPAKREFLTRARAKAAVIQTDFGTANYDPTLKKYRKPKKGKGSEIPKIVITVLMWLDRYLDYRVTQGTLEEITINNRWNPLRRHMERSGLFADMPGEALSVELAQNFTDYLGHQSMAKRSIRDYLSVLRGLGKYLKHQGVITSNVFEEVEIRIYGSKRRKQSKNPFTRDELTRILTTAKDHDRFTHYYLFILCLLNWGLRISELIGLRWCDINFQKAQVTIGSSLPKTGTYHRKRKSTKTGSIRTLDINQRLLELLQSVRSDNVSTDALIFRTVTGRVINDNRFRSDVWKPLLEVAKVEYRSPHTCRHTFASLGIEEYGWTDYQAAELLGHSSTKMIQQVYGHAINKGALPEI